MGIENIQISQFLLHYFIDTIQIAEVSNLCWFRFQLGRRQELDSVFCQMTIIFHLNLILFDWLSQARSADWFILLVDRFSLLIESLLRCLNIPLDSTFLWMIAFPIEQLAWSNHLFVLIIISNNACLSLDLMLSIC